MKRGGLAGAAAVAVFLVGIAVWWRGHPRASPPHENAVVAGERSAPAESAPPQFPLGAPGTTIVDDVRLLASTFLQWQTNFPSTGNPVGTNAEITAALCGANALQLDLIPRGHPAINVRGELCDRWGTPFRFHQLSGTQMEIISAGPDRRFATGDDARAP